MSKNRDEESEKTPVFPPQSLNNRFILESYKEDRALKATVTNGFAMVQQKVSLKGLKLLVNISGTKDGAYFTFNAGAMVYIREEYLQNQPWAKKFFTSDAIEGEFMIVEAQFIEFVVPA